MEKIQTGLTANYVPNWTVKAAVKEAAQNIAYGAAKSGIPARMESRDGVGIMEDHYTGFDKRHLYIGESEQRDDADGLGNFGEGWKVFLLVMARELREHRVNTVGFTFWGTMEDTPHGVKTLVINVVENDRKVGTLAYAECSEADFNAAFTSFASLNGIDQKYIREASVIPGRLGELWINGVRIEQGDNLNPLELHYAYNLKDRTLMNRDRSQVNSVSTFQAVRSLLTNQDRGFVWDFVQTALDGVTKQDVVRGPYFISQSDDTAQKWIGVIEDLHGASQGRLALTSNNPDTDREAKMQGYKLLRLPGSWASELRFIGFKYAHEVITVKPDFETVDDINNLDRNNLRKAKLDVRKALGLNSVRDLPQIVVVQSLKDKPGFAFYNADTATVYIESGVLYHQYNTTKALLIEAMKWREGASDEAYIGWVKAVMRLLGYEAE